MGSAFEFNESNNQASDLLRQLVALQPEHKELIEKVLLLIDSIQAKAEKLKIENKELLLEKAETSRELKRFSGLFVASPIPQMIVNRAGIIVDVNKSFCKLFGKNKASFLRNKFVDFLLPQFHDVFYNSIRQVSENRNEHLCELKVFEPSKGELSIQLISEPHDGDGFGEQLIHSVIHDITASKAREADLLRFSAAFEQSANSILITDTSGKIQYANPRFYEVSGFKPEEVIGQNPRILKYEKSHINYKELWKTISEGNVWTGEFLNKSKSGKLFWEIGTITPVKDGSGNIINYLAIKEDITKRKEAERNLALSEQKFRALYDKSYDAILILDGGKIVDCNLKAGVLFKTTCRTIQRKKLLDFCYEKQPGGEKCHDLLRAQFKTALIGKPVTFDLVMKQEERAFEAEVSLTRIYLDHKPMIQAIIRDVSEKRMAESLIMKAKEEAEKARKAQSDFLSLMSHEIRTPLNAVVSLTDLLLHEKLSPDQLENLNSVKISARHLLGLIDDILDFNKIDSGNIQFENHNFDIGLLVKELVQTLKVKAIEKGLEFSAQIDKNVPAVLVGDSLRLKQVLFNLLSNGIKFTDRGFVTLNVKNQSGKKGGKIVFEVEDSGIGILKDRLTAIFEKFTQAETSTTRKYGGSGLGLTVCKKLIELQGGEIFARSTPGKGSTFTFYLPLTKGSMVSEQKTRLPESGTTETLQGMRILMVEDDKMNQFVGKRILEGKGKATLTIASTGEEALSILQAHEFDLILMDLLLPVIDGCQITRIIRSNQGGKIKNPKVPIIALTADAFLETRKRAFEAGVDDFVTKPFDFIKLFSRIVKYRPAINP